MYQQEPGRGGFGTRPRTAGLLAGSTPTSVPITRVAPVQRLRRNKQLTQDDLDALEEMLLASGAGQRVDIAWAAERSHGLGVFIRELGGLDRQAAMEAFETYLDEGRPTVEQIRFVELIVGELTANGIMEPRRLYESPYTDQAPTGPDCLFPDADVEVIVDVLDQVEAHAVPTGAA